MIRPDIVCFLLYAITSLRAEPFNRAIVTKSNGNVLFLGEGMVKTGKDSRVELEFPDLTVARIGSSTHFRFIPGTREMSLASGAMLFSSPENTEGGTIRSEGIVVRVGGADLQMSSVAGRVKVVCLGGKVLVYLEKTPRVRARLALDDHDRRDPAGRRGEGIVERGELAVAIDDQRCQYVWHPVTLQAPRRGGRAPRRTRCSPNDLIRPFPLLTAHYKPLATKSTL